MAMAAMSAVGTGSAVVCSAKLGYCRRVVGIVGVQRQRGKEALTMHFEPPKKV